MKAYLENPKEMTSKLYSISSELYSRLVQNFPNFILTSFRVNPHPEVCPTLVNTEPALTPKQYLPILSLLKIIKMPCEPNLIIIADDDRDDCLFLLSALLSTPLGVIRDHCS